MVNFAWCPSWYYDFEVWCDKDVHVVIVIIHYFGIPYHTSITSDKDTVLPVWGIKPSEKLTDYINMYNVWPLVLILLHTLIKFVYLFIIYRPAYILGTW